MVSRLDRLFILLDSGSNESVRLAAAKQLGEVQRVQPDDLHYLVQRIKEYSGKSLWETRVAAGQATRYVLEHVGPWPTSKLTGYEDNEKFRTRLEIAEKLIEQNINCNRILEQFDLDKIMFMCPKLLSLDESNVDDAELVNPSTSKSSTSSNRGSRGARKDSTAFRGSRKSKNDKEQLLRQRKLINKELGLMDSLNFGVKSTDIVSNDDLKTDYTELKEGFSEDAKSSPKQHDVRMILQKSVSNYDNILNILHNHDCISKHNIPLNFETPSSSTLNDSNTEPISTNSSGFCDTQNWPLANITKQYTDDLFNPSWEVRHGAAIALREIVKLQGSYAGKLSVLSETANNQLNQIWLVDMALRALCVLALDKFGDFLFDQVVAPVRENAAQLLGCCVSHMSEPNACSTIKLILRMLENSNWETRHGGILGLKYYLSVVDESISKRVLQECFDSIFKCLGDSVDDVSAEAAASLVPVKDLMIETIPEKAPKLIKFLWDHLADLDELTTSTSNIVLLLASLITSSSAQLEPIELTKSIPRLWSLLGHSSSTVRISVLKAFITLIKPQKSCCLSWMPEDQMTTVLRLLFQRSILENMEEVRFYIEEVWMLMIRIDTEAQNAQTDRFNLLKCTSQFLNYWLCLIMQPYNTPLDRGYEMWLNIKPDGTKSDTKPDGEIYIGSCSFNAETIDQQKQQVTKCRLLATKLIGSLYANLVNDSCDSQHAKETLKYLTDMFTHYIKTKSANQRIVCGWAVESWACYQTKLLGQDYTRLKELLPNTFAEQLNSALQENSLCYDELATTFTRLQQETRNFVSSLIECKISLNIPHSSEKRIIYNLNQIQSLCEVNLESELTKLVSKRNQSTSKDQMDYDIKKSEAFTSLSTRKANLRKSLRQTNSSQKALTTSVLSSLAFAHISWRLIPENLKLITQPLLDSIELEEEQTLQDKSINYLVILFDILSHNEKHEHDKLLETIFKELLDILSCGEFNRYQNGADSDGANGVSSSSCDSSLIKNLSDIKKKGDGDSCKIILLDNLQRKAELNRTITRRQSSITTTSGLKRSHSLTSAEIESETILQEDNLNSQQAQNDLTIVKRRGASTTLSRLACHFGENLPQKLPLFWSSITTSIKTQVEEIKKQKDHSTSDYDEIQLIKNLLLLEVVGECLDVKLRSHLLGLYTDLIQLLYSTNPNIRHQSAKCIGIISKLMLAETTELINKDIIPMLEQNENILARCGAVEAIAFIIEHLQMDLVPRINMFIIHVLRRMSDQNDQIRLMATHCFGKLLCLMPLNLEKCKQMSETDIKPSNDQLASQDNQRFIEQLLDPKRLDCFVMPFEMKAKLRSYQQDGLNWLAFLNRFNLHGILCDEMGLGKTFMTICMVGSDHFGLKKDKHQQISSTCPSLIICPSTLTEHWLYEIEKFLDAEARSILNPVAYSGNLNDRMSLRVRILSALNRNKENSQLAPDNLQQPDVNLIVASYDIVRNDIEFFKDVQWNYCVLDEGHIIKNGKTKLSKAIRLLTAKHRLILSGTPIQNNVTELWSLFDFLMPGFLGSERQFHSRYAKPILQSREPKSSSRELEAGVLAMESLHRQVLPFILRRLKEDVLDDLPPKIIQDYYCELSPLQLKLYEDFTRSKLCKEVTKKSVMDLEEQDSDKKANSKSHVFQALQYLKNVCNHPKLVLAEKHSQYSEIKKSLENDKSSLDDIAHSSKLKALKQLLIDCGIGVINQPGDEQHQQSLTVESVVNQHRALVFCQIRSMVNIIENDLLKKHLPSITYLKLDGSVPASQRQSIVSRFNNDPSIDILLLTTQIGGLGLNLTGADTVIFVEHDWNPTKDLQAMDRAHRIGQKKVVNVYRLITKGTLEEKIMGLQKFKTMVSNTVINQDNAGLGTMNVNELFDLFNEQQTTGDRGGSSVSGETANKLVGSKSGKKSSSSSFMELLPELWDQQQYETEYDLSSFVSSLKN